MGEIPGLTVNQRVKQIRKPLKLTWHDFAKVLAVSGGLIWANTSRSVMTHPGSATTGSSIRFF
jgi:hypothetical protein